MTATPPVLDPGGRSAAWRRPGRVRYVVCDVDGTLIGPQPLATPRVVAALAAARDAGVRVGYATGRMRDAVADLHTQLGAAGPHVLHNGGEVRLDGRTVAAWPLHPASVDALLHLGRERDDAYLEVYTESGYLASAMDTRASGHWELLGGPPRATLSAAAALEGQPVLKATFAAFSAAAERALVDAVAALGLRPGVAASPRTPELTYVNATHPDADKGRALRRAVEAIGVDLAEVVAVGDASNDLPMLAVAGTAVAMGQADAEVRAAADLVAPSVDADGVAAVLEALVAWNAAPPNDPGPAGP